MEGFAVIAIGYNRLDSLNRLLNALEKAEYGGDIVTLIISLDFNPDDSLRIYAKDFLWSHGKKIMNFYDRQQGLRKHVIQCGNYLNQYELEAVAVFEDDILPSAGYYMYMKKAVGFYRDFEQIAGIALYSFRVNPFIYQSFYPAENGFDTFLMQFPCSWGQIWTRKQWNAFYDWYKENENVEISSHTVPAAVSNWPSSSWLKYYTKYCIVQDKYFVYPYNALSTNFNEAGTHVKEQSDLFQVVLQDKGKAQYSFCSLDSTVKYDAFFERAEFGNKIGIAQKDLCIDLYGSRHTNSGKRYWLTTIKKSFKVIASYGLKMIPQEQNVLYNVAGRQIFLYDTWAQEESMRRVAMGKQRKKLVLYGCGQIGKAWLDFLGDASVYCFADSNKEGETVCGKKVLGIEELKKLQKEIEIYISTNWDVKKEIYRKLKKEGLVETVVGSPYRTKEIYADADSFFDTKTEFEGKNALLTGVQLRRCKLGYASYISAGTVLFDTEIGRYSSIGPNIRLIRGQHPTRKFVSTHPVFYSTQQTIQKSYVSYNLFEEYRYAKEGVVVSIGNDVWIGDGVTIMEGVRIADGTIVAAGSHVVKDTEPFSIIGGNPAKLIRYRFDEEEIQFLKKLQWWNQSEKWVEKYASCFNDIKKLREKLDR